MPPKRNTAFTVSFPDETGGADISFRTASGPEEIPDRTGSAKRKADGSRRCDPDKRPRKDVAQESERHAGPPVQTVGYQPHPDEIVEDADTVVQGEDADDYQDDEGTPVRQLSNFVVFDPSHGFELIPLEILDDASGSGRQCEATGCVAPIYLNEEDAGQEDGMEDDEESQPQRLRTSAVFRYFIDYSAIDDPIYIQTQYAWYTLKSPAKAYKRIHRDFYTPHRVAQIIISVAREGAVTNFAEFEELYIKRWDDLLEDCIQMEDVLRSIPLLNSILEDDTSLRDKVVSRPFVKHILGLVDKQSTYPVRQIPSPVTSRANRPHGTFLQLSTLTGNFDIAVVRPENQNPTHVTPLIDKLALGLFREHLRVVGAAPKRLTDHQLKQRRLRVREHINELLIRTLDHNPKMQFPVAERLDGKFWKAVKIRGELYKLGDCVVMIAGPHNDRPAPYIPSDLRLVPDHAALADYFWFGKIVYIDQRAKEIHIQYYEHSSKTYLEEISNPQELFLCPQYCETQSLFKVLGKVNVYHDHDPASGKEIDARDFFCRFMYDEEDGSFTDLHHGKAHTLPPPDNCPVCDLSAWVEIDEYPELLENGLKFAGIKYHHHDYVLIADTDALLKNSKNLTAPGFIGKIIRIRRGKPSELDGSETFLVTVKCLGRMSDLLSEPTFGAPANTCADERELFITDMEMDVNAINLIARCGVTHQSEPGLRSWLARSPHHFFVQYSSRSLQPKRWDELKQLTELEICKKCYRAGEKEAEHLNSFAKRPGACLKAFDPFAGVGAFGLAMEETGCVKVTHAVEISPSAAATLRKNSPSTTLYNQCSNVVLRYAVKTHAKQWEGAPPQNIEGTAPLPPPPNPNQIDCIVAGFPCQPHSTLNMFQKANDRKSHLILNLLSWVDFLQPKYCVFENVRGFLNYNLNVSQAGRHRVTGGIEMGGLKFLVHALLTMGYQVRFSLLQAGQYGAPQRRVRFFLLASLKDHPLPSFPEPTHAVLHPDQLLIHVPNRDPLKPRFATDPGTAPFKAVSIVDAIDDLVRFEWAENGLKPAKGVLSVVCDYTKPYCGPPGDYRFPPQTSYQVACRKKPTTNIQHYTRVFKPAMISRIVHVPLDARADYRSLAPNFAEFQFANPASATARHGFRPGMYGRLHKKDWFHTTVTNVDPTAKQSYVLHPTYRRIFTIRELARSQGFPDWFVFIAHRDRMKTIHRQIGNAVPWQVGEALGRELKKAMFEKWKQDKAHPITVE